MQAADVRRLLERFEHVTDDLMGQIDAELGMHLGI